MVRNAARTGDRIPWRSSDGRATAGGDDHLAEAHRAAAELARTGTPCLVLDAETGRNRLGLAQTLADRLGAEHVELHHRPPSPPTDESASTEDPGGRRIRLEPEIGQVDAVQSA